MQTLLSSSFFSFLLPSSPLCGGGAPSLFLRLWEWGGADVLVAERWSGMERGGGGQSDVKGPNGVLPSDEEHDGSIRCVLNLKATPSLSRSGHDRSLVTFWCLRVATFRPVLGTRGLVHCRGTRLLFCNLFLGAIRGSIVVCVSLTSWRVRGPGCFCLWALVLVEVCGGRVCGETSFSRGCSVSLVVTPVCAFLTSWRSGKAVLCLVFGPTLVVDRGVTLFCCFVVLYS
ncbi:hypothetical protein Taro_007070, partial [Colocasia esculenta]|nr:hypothetical protein [Colocasia esculenta]